LLGSGIKPAQAAFVNAEVVSIVSKGTRIACQVRTREANASEPPTRGRKNIDDVKTEFPLLTRDKPGGNQPTDQAASGLKVARSSFRLLHGTWETCRHVQSNQQAPNLAGSGLRQGKHKVERFKCENLSQSMAGSHGFGVTHSSEETE